MVPGFYSIQTVQGSTLLESFTFYNSDGVTPVNLTGFTASMDVRDTQGNLIISLSTTNGRIALGGALGTCALTITATDSNALTPGNYKYDLYTITGSEKDVWLTGAFDISPRVSQ